MENVKKLTKCEINPTDYKLCSPYTCVTRETPCRTGMYVGCKCQKHMCTVFKVISFVCFLFVSLYLMLLVDL